MFNLVIDSKLDTSKIFDAAKPASMVSRNNARETAEHTGFMEVSGLVLRAFRRKLRSTPELARSRDVSCRMRRIDMDRGSSLKLLLGLLAVAGYQNRDKIAEMLRGVGQGNSPASGPGSQPGGLGGLLGNL